MQAPCNFSFVNLDLSKDSKGVTIDTVVPACLLVFTLGIWPKTIESRWKKTRTMSSSWIGCLCLLRSCRGSQRSRLFIFHVFLQCSNFIFNFQPTSTAVEIKTQHHLVLVTICHPVSCQATLVQLHMEGGTPLCRSKNKMEIEDSCRVETAMDTIYIYFSGIIILSYNVKVVSTQDWANIEAQHHREVASAILFLARRNRHARQDVPCMHACVHVKLYFIECNAYTCKACATFFHTLDLVRSGHQRMEDLKFIVQQVRGHMWNNKRGGGGNDTWDGWANF